MIGRLTGRCVYKKPPEIILDVQGVGYEVVLPMSSYTSLPQDNSTITLFTHLSIREDAHVLFGFTTLEEREAFRALIKITGVGPKIALALLSAMNVTTLASAIEGADAALLARTPGIGKKTAERLCLELKGKLSPGVAGLTSPISSVHQDILEGLIALGYSDKEARGVVKTLPADISVNAGLTAALKTLART